MVAAEIIITRRSVWRVAPETLIFEVNVSEFDAAGPRAGEKSTTPACTSFTIRTQADRNCKRDPQNRWNMAASARLIDTAAS